MTTKTIKFKYGKVIIEEIDNKDMKKIKIYVYDTYKEILRVDIYEWPSEEALKRLFITIEN